jgi:hypothetical protein
LPKKQFHDEKKKQNQKGKQNVPGDGERLKDSNLIEQSACWSA